MSDHDGRELVITIVWNAQLSACARTVSLKHMRHDDKAGAKKSERDCYVEHGTHPYSRLPA
jgi:hypothetical protein